MKLDRKVLVIAMFALGACKSTAPDPGPPPAAATSPTAPATAKPAPAIPAQAQPATPGADPWSKPAPKKDPLARPMFWSIEKDGKTTFLLGTIHLGVDAETRLPDLVWKQLDAAPTFAMETDLSDGSLMDSFKRTSGTLHEELGPAYWKKLEDALGPQVAKGIDGMKAMVPASVLAMRGMPQTPPMDGILVERAKREHKQIVFLEPASAETAVLEKWMDTRALKEMLDDTEGPARQTALLDAYLAGDDAKMLALTDDERTEAVKHGYTNAEYDQEMDDLLFHRNASWIGAIEKLHAGGGGFIAVGAAHLIGKGSVLDLLAKRGYKVTRVAPPA